LASLEWDSKREESIYSCIGHRAAVITCSVGKFGGVRTWRDTCRSHRIVVIIVVFIIYLCFACLSVTIEREWDEFDSKWAFSIIQKEREKISTKYLKLRTTHSCT
jgi:hypothetical protein